MAWTWNRGGLTAFMSRLFTPPAGVEDFPILAALGCSVGGTVHTLTAQPRRCDVHGFSQRDATLALAEHIDALLDRQPATHTELVVRIMPFVSTVDAVGDATLGPWVKAGHYDVMAERPHDAPWATGGGGGALVLQSQPFVLGDDDEEPEDGDDDDDDMNDDGDPDDDDGFDDDGDAGVDPDDDADPDADPDADDPDAPDDLGDDPDGTPDDGESDDAAASALLDLPPRRRTELPQQQPQARQRQRDQQERPRENHIAPRRRARRPPRGHMAMQPHQPGVYYVQTPQGFMPVMAPPPTPVVRQESDANYRDVAAAAYFELAKQAISTALGASDRQHKGQQDQVTHLTAALTDANKQSAGQMERIVAAERAAVTAAETRNRDEIRRLEAEVNATRQALAQQQNDATRAVSMLTEELNKSRDATAKAKADAKAASSEGSLEERVMEQAVELALPRILERVLPSMTPPTPPAPAAPPPPAAAAQTPAAPRRVQAEAEVEYIDDEPAPTPTPRRMVPGQRIVQRRVPPATRAAPEAEPAAATTAEPAAAGGLVGGLSSAVEGLKGLMHLPKPVRDMVVKQIAAAVGEGDFATLVREMNELGDKS